MPSDLYVFVPLSCVFARNTEGNRLVPLKVKLKYQPVVYGGNNRVQSIGRITARDVSRVFTSVDRVFWDEKPYGGYYQVHQFRVGEG